ncbi:bifunctional diguanylate cyclase/phosphodiesterase [Ureibacillus acetophenoni]|uniref:Diguanylate cyclase/phosphodiesterase with PAS/PAC sensor(S) n=1 Tax=Ureibacillus acetophenoni TaxID=614649 RepID=A0A285UDH1_9BACL|nr:bifunctional diguanylate cyclase/phosphodiesterase [Ureibacillus acetophenoni]SOC39737.1 diguanylate cyclase/phosphodiesterase with PAS/PAC sensor(s) [Ureibacillus acetophenoni]
MKYNYINNEDEIIELENLPLKVRQKLEKLQLLEYAIDQSSIVIVFDKKGEIIYVNDLACESSQYSRDELIGQQHAFFYSNTFKANDLKDMVKTLLEGRIWKGEMQNEKKDGSKFWVHSIVVPIVGEEGETVQYYSISTEITKEKEFAEEARRNNENYRLIAENTINLLTLIESNGSFRYVSPTFNTLLNYDVASLINGNFFDLIHPEDLEAVKHDVQTYCRKRKEPLLMEFRICNNSGNHIDVEATIRIISNSTYSSNELLLIVMRDIRNRKAVEQTVYHLAYHDSLTNFPNRRSFISKLRDEMMNRSKTKSKLAILFIDLDNFKNINDQWGHDIGDLVLKEAANTIQSVLSKKDVAARFGGDEFVVMLKDIDSEEEASAVVKKLLEKFQTPLNIDGVEHRITCSLGVALYPDHGTSSDELIKNADDALYTVKGNGKNNFSVFNESIEHQSFERRILENALRKGIKERQFYLEYQPKLNICTNEVIGMEALVRWKHPDLGTIPPMKFIPLAESTGLIVPLGEWVLRESCRQTKEWQDKGYGPLSVSVNISVRQLEEPNFIEQVHKILKETGLDPKWLEFEVTESIFADLKNTVSILQEVRKLGIQISVDDFGTGYSSLSYIKHLPIDTLKVDQSFVKDIHVNQESQAIVLAVLNLAKTIGLNVIAEGIELEEHVSRLSERGLLFGQGYYYSKPLRKEAFEEFVNNNAVV